MVSINVSLDNSFETARVRFMKACDVLILKEKNMKVEDYLLLAGWIVGVAVLAVLVCLCLIVICILVIVVIRLSRQLTNIAAADTTDKSYTELKVNSTRNTLDCDQSNYSSCILFSYIGLSMEFGPT